jgi:pyridoxal phosphate enzyme (YggS family)
VSPGADQADALLLRWQGLRDILQAAHVQLLAVSKYAPDAAVETLIGAGQIHFGESRAQGLRDRAARWPQCEWHMIGPMQKNKAKYIGRQAAMWHSCDNLEIAGAVSQHVTGRQLPVLIQVNIADNPEQRGIQPVDAAVFAESLSAIDHLKLCGLMGMAPRDGDVRSAFRRLRRLRDELFGGSFAELCMGMSGDYRTAIEEGATIVRIGSTLFDYNKSNGSAGAA